MTGARRFPSFLKGHQGFLCVLCVLCGKNGFWCIPSFSPLEIFAQVENLNEVYPKLSNTSSRAAKRRGRYNIPKLSCPARVDPEFWIASLLALLATTGYATLSSKRRIKVMRNLYFSHLCSSVVSTLPVTSRQRGRAVPGIVFVPRNLRSRKKFRPLVSWQAEISFWKRWGTTKARFWATDVECSATRHEIF